MNVLRIFGSGRRPPTLESAGYDEAAIERIAYHEAGHAVAAWALGVGGQIKSVVLAPDGSSVGLVTYKPHPWMTSQNVLMDTLVRRLAGRAAEQEVYGPDNLSNLCGGDLAAATKLGLEMVCTLGMGRGTGLFSLEPKEAVADEKIRNEVNALLAAAYDDALSIVAVHRRSLDDLAGMLASRRTMSGREVIEVLGKAPGR